MILSKNCLQRGSKGESNLRAPIAESLTTPASFRLQLVAEICEQGASNHR